MVYEDDAGCRRAVAAILDRSGFHVAVSAGSAQDVLEQLRRLAPDVVVFELALAAARGLKFVADLRSAAPCCQVILLSPFESLREAAVKAGASALVGNEDLRDFEWAVRRLARHGTPVES
ncbi:MAG: response regulator [Actinomycetota bacterium]|nr:response regulator [Actinomycetota bacterium]